MEQRFISFAWYVVQGLAAHLNPHVTAAKLFWNRGEKSFPSVGQKKVAKFFLSTYHSAKILLYELMWCDGTRLFPPICTRWLPTRDWVRSSGERDFYNKFSHPQHQHVRKSGFGFSPAVWPGGGGGVSQSARRKNVNNLSAQEMESFQLEMITLFIRKNWVKLRWKFDFRREEVERREVKRQSCAWGWKMRKKWR